MNLLFVIPEYPPHFGGGIGTFYAQFLPSLVKMGHSVKVLVANPFSDEFPAYREQGVSVSCLPHKAIAAQLPGFAHYASMPELQRTLATAWAAWEFVNGGQGFDGVETTDWGLSFAPWVMSEDSPPSIVQLHGSIGQIDFHDPQFDKQVQGHLVRAFEMGCFAVADVLQTNSLANARYWTELTGRSVDYIPPALQVPELQAKSGQAKSGQAKSGQAKSGQPEQVGVVVGRIQQWKGAEVLCQALQRLGEAAPKMIWIGRDTVFRQLDGSMSDYLAQHYPKIWHQQIQCLGALSTIETRQYQRGAGFILVPSTWDVFNYACVEGMSYGRAVLCSDGAGAADLIETGVNGIRFKPNDPQALATALEHWIGLSASQRSQMGQAAQDTVRTRLNPSVIAQTRAAAYAKLIHQGRSQVKLNDWMKAAIAPHQPMGNPLAFLDYLPLKNLAQYVVKRSLKKLKP